MSPVNFFLIDLKIALNNGLTFVPRDKNQATINKLEITHTQIKSELYSLTKTHYFSGPEEDSDPNKSGDIWVFKKDIQEQIIYIKLKLYTVNNTKYVKCLSFHIDE